tara:strand:- start:39 stop:467 length:429 start_codon:yes stop_codon:yes gene_type:complete
MVAAFWISEPAQVLIVAPNSQLPLAPFVHRMPHSRFMRLIGGQRRYNRAMRRGSIRAADHLRYDRTAVALMTDERDELGRTRLAVHPAIPLGLLWTLGECDHVQLAMRRMFADRDGAELAAADVVRVIEQIGRETGTLIESQ